MRTVRQPMPKPTTYEEYLRLRPSMIDTAGQALELFNCRRCAREHFTVEPCADEAPCPRCGSTAARCHRPSGHDADTWHTSRILAYESLCAEREAAGIPQVARWPDA